MVCCFHVACFFCTLCVFLGLASLVQLCLGIYLSFIQPDVMNINRLIKTDQYDSYLAYILLVFIGIGFVSFILTFFSIHGMIKRNRSLSLFVAALWVISMILNLIMLTVLLLYYFMVLPQLSSLLTRNVQKSPLMTLNFLEQIQFRYRCCGINNKDDYKHFSFDSLPSSCCRTDNCWHEIDTNKNNSSTTTTTSIPMNMFWKGCYPIIDRYVTLQLWTLMVVAGLCAGFQFFAIILMCVLNQRYKKFDDNDPKLAVAQLASGVPTNANIEHNIQGSSTTIEETVEITQI